MKNLLALTAAFFAFTGCVLNDPLPGTASGTTKAFYGKCTKTDNSSSEDVSGYLDLNGGTMQGDLGPSYTATTGSTCSSQWSNMFVKPKWGNQANTVALYAANAASAAILIDFTSLYANPNLTDWQTNAVTGDLIATQYTCHMYAAERVSGSCTSSQTSLVHCGALGFSVCKN